MPTGPDTIWHSVTAGDSSVPEQLLLVAPALDENIKNEAVLVDGTPEPMLRSGLTCAITRLARPIAACMCSMPKPGIVSSGIVRAADLHQYDVDRQPALSPIPPKT